MQRRPLHLGLLAMFTLLTIGSAHAQVVAAPPLINFQGRLAKPDGTPLADGGYTVTFTLLDAVTGGSQKWTETDNLTVRNGVFAILLGNMTAFPAGLFNGNLWLEIKVGGDPPLTPRQQLVSVAYAMKANTVPDGSITGAKIAAGTITPDKLTGGGSPPTGAAGGDLTGTYPNPLLATLASSLAKVSGTMLTALPNGQTIDQRQDSTGGACSGGVLSQSFTPGVTGNLVGLDIALNLGAGSSQTVTLQIFTGDLTYAQLLTSQPVTVSGGGIQFQHFTLITPTPLTSGQKYTWVLTGNNIGNVVAAAVGNVYAGGQANCNGNGTIDYAFRTYMDGGVPVLNAAANLNVAGKIGIYGSNTLEFGADVLGKEVNAGKIGYQTFDDALDIVGAGTAANGSDRKIKLHGQGGITAIGNFSASSATIPTLNGAVSIVDTGFPSLVVNTTSGVGTWVRLNNTSAGGHNWNVISSGASNGEGAGKLLFNDQTSGGTRMVLDNNGRLGIGTATPAYPLDVNGIAQVHAVNIVGGSDVAEPYTVARGRIQPLPGMVVSIDNSQIGRMKITTRPYDKSVAGIISGANGIHPGITLRQKGSVADGEMPIASLGRVWCLCDADANGPIHTGDMLTTSPIPGHAMKVRSYRKAEGAVIGKAMSSLKSGRGLVLVLVSLK